MKRLAVIWFGRGMLVAAAVTLAGCGGAPRQEGFEAHRHPVIVVAVDGLRADALGCYGNGEARTPSFDALAAQSVRFEWAFAQAGDAAVSFASLLTGDYPTTAGVRSPGDRLRDDAQTLAESFAAANLQTTAFVKGQPDGDAYGLDQGFAGYTLGTEAAAAAVQWLGKHAGDDFLLVLRGWPVPSPLAGGAEASASPAPPGFRERLQKLLAPMAGEEPPPLEPDDVEYVRQLYGDAIASLDASLADFMSRLEAAGLTERATLVVLGTAGLDLLQHGVEGRESVHTTVTRVPLLIRFPGASTAATVGSFVELVDVMPTLLDMEGVEIPAQVQGRSLLPIIRGEGTPPYRAFSESPLLGGQVAVALGGLRLLERGEASPALYDLMVDPLETQDVAAANQDRVQVMQRQVDAWRQMVTAASLDPEVRASAKPIDDATLERLKSLGYVH